MILPTNGKIVIIDDSPEDVMHLSEALTRNKFPFLFYKNLDMEDLPEQPVSGVRLVFLDLDLGLGGTSAIEKVRLVQERLYKIIEPNCPYMLVIWSSHEDRYAKTLIEEFEGRFKNYKPLLICSLDKVEIKKLKDEGKTEDNKIIQLINDKLEEKLSEFKSFNAFLLWESIVNDSGQLVVKDILNLFSINKDTWDDTSKHLLYKLSKAHSGSFGDSFNELTKLKNAFYTLNNSLTDTLDSKVNEINGKEFEGMVSDKEVEIENFETKLNKALILSENCDSLLEPGNIYLIKETFDKQKANNQAEYERKIEYIKRQPEDRQAKALEPTEKKFKSLETALTVGYSKTTKIFNRVVYDCLDKEIMKKEGLKLKDLSAEIKWIELNITPICDYAQSKACNYRMLPGILVPSKFKHFFIKGPSYTYMSDPSFHIYKDNYFLIFDFRWLYALEACDLEDHIVAFRLRHQMISDIQIQLSAHVSRSGIYYVS